MNSGKGLQALIRQNTSAMPEQTESIHKIDINLIDPNPYQPRKEFDQAKLAELCESIKRHGVIAPVLVRKKYDGRFELIAGERRLRASKMADMRVIPAYVKIFTDKESLEIALIENIQREDINPVETAEGYRRLMNEFSYTQEELSKVIGKSRSAIANTLRLLILPQTVLDLIARKEISEGHGRCVLSVDEEKRLEFALMIVNRKLSVRQAEEEAKKLNGTKKEHSEEVIHIKPFVVNAKKSLSAFFRTKVRIQEKDGKGKIIISFDTEEELAEILKNIRG